MNEAHFCPSSQPASDDPDEEVTAVPSAVVAPLLWASNRSLQALGEPWQSSRWRLLLPRAALGRHGAGYNRSRSGGNPVSTRPLRQAQGAPGTGPEAQVRGRHERGRGDGPGSTANPVGLWELRGSEPVRCLQLQVTEDPIRV